MSRLRDLAGQRFGRLSVVARAETGKGGNARWHCRCDCGGKTTTTGNNLRKGHTESCGCLHRERAALASLTHGHSRRDRRHWLYRTWNSMVHRCTNPKVPFWARYGGRGISVHESWESDFQAFLDYVESDLGPKPTPAHTLDRIDNDGNYEPGNLRWATPSEQQLNRRRRRAA